MVKLVNALTALGAATVNPDGSIDPSTSSASTAAPMCAVTTASLDQSFERFHSDDVCERRSFNAFKDSLNRHAKYLSLKENGRHLQVPDAKTVSCPAVVQPLMVPGQQVGYDTAWIVENTASTPVVLSYIAADGTEKSALDSTVSPPEADPDAILPPGAWRAVQTFDGHVFHARELLPDGTTGRILLQHRVGLIPVGANAARRLVCPDSDTEPIVTLDDGTEDTDPEFQRTPEREYKDCNTIEIGFRNVAGCPLHGYYLRPNSCDESFKFHLGVEPAVEDFMWDWQSPAKYESSYVGHTFVFRSAFSDQIVEQVTLQPTQIVDCPGLQQAVASAVAAQSIIVPTGAQVGHRPGNHGNYSNNTTAATGAASLPATPGTGTHSLFYSAGGGSF